MEGMRGEGECDKRGTGGGGESTKNKGRVRKLEWVVGWGGSEGKAKKKVRKVKQSVQRVVRGPTLHFPSDIRSRLRRGDDDPWPPPHQTLCDGQFSKRSKNSVTSTH